MFVKGHKTSQVCVWNLQVFYIYHKNLSLRFCTYFGVRSFCSPVSDMHMLPTCSLQSLGSGVHWALCTACIPLWISLVAEQPHVSLRISLSHAPCPAWPSSVVRKQKQSGAIRFPLTTAFVGQQKQILHVLRPLRFKVRELFQKYITEGKRFCSQGPSPLHLLSVYFKRSRSWLSNTGRSDLMSHPCCQWYVRLAAFYSSLC